jgi:YD repeat-containing protein
MTDAMGTVSYVYNSTGLLTSQTDRTGGATNFGYDGYERVISTTDSTSGSRKYNYDLQYGLLNSTTDSFGRNISFQYDIMGNRNMTIDRNTKQTGYTYDGLNRLRHIHDANNGDVYYDYDANGNRTKIIDSAGNITNYQYDALNRLNYERYSDSSYIKYEYSSEGDMRKRQVYNKTGVVEKTQDFSYDNAHRLINDGLYTYTYGPSGCSCSNRISSVTGPNGTIAYDYDFKGRIVGTTVNGTKIGHVYNDPAKTITVSLGTTPLFVITRDGEGRAVSVVDNVSGGNKTFSITRDAMGRILQTSYPNGCT